MLFRNNMKKIQKWMVVNALKIAFVVGIALNFINQGDVLLSGNLHKVNILKLCLTFCVPFGVSLYSSYKAQYNLK